MSERRQSSPAAAQSRNDNDSDERGERASLDVINADWFAPSTL